MADNKDVAWQNWFEGSAYEDGADDLTLSLTSSQSPTTSAAAQNMDGIQTSTPQPQTAFMAKSLAGSTSSSVVTDPASSSSTSKLPSNQKPRRRGLWVVVILLLLLAIGGLVIKRGHDARLSQLEQEQQQAEQQSARLQSEVDALVVNDGVVDGDVTVTDEPEDSDSAKPTGQVTTNTATPGSAGSQGMQGATGANGAIGPQGARGAQGPSGVATCPNGNCLSLQTNPSTTQETGSINISGDGDFGGEVNANAVNTANIATTGLTVYGTLAGTDANFTGALTAADILQGGNVVCDDSNNCNYAAASGSSNYIQNGTSAQTASFNITGNGIITGLLSVQGTLGTISTSSTGNNLSFSRAGINYITATNASGHLFLGNSSANSALQILNTATNNSLVLNGGNVGIGTMNPSQKLHVAGRIVSGIDITPVSATPYGITVGDNTTHIFNYYGQSATNNTGYGWVYNATSADAYAWLYTSGYLNDVRIDAKNVLLQTNTIGNVGIGTTSPSEKLQVTGNGLFSGSITGASLFQGANQVCDTSNNCSYAAGTGSTGYIQNQTASPQTAGFNISGNGYVGGNFGVGTEIPGAKLQVAAGTGTTTAALFQAGVNGYQVQLGGTSASPYIQGLTSVGTATNLVLQPSGGNVGIGTSSPSTKLHVLTASGSAGTFESSGVAALDILRTGQTGLRLSSNGGSAVSTIGLTDGTASIIFNHFNGGGSTTGGVGIGGPFGGASSVKAALHVLSRAANDEALIVQGATSQTANLLELQNSSGTVLTYVAAGGQVRAPSLRDTTGAGPTLALNATNILLQTQGTTSNGLLVRGAAGQTADLLQAQDSAGTVLAKIGASGSLTVQDAEVQGSLAVTGDATFSGDFITFSNNIRGYNLSVGDTETTLDVTFDTAHSDANYGVFCTPNWDTTCFVSNKSTSGFTLNFGTAAGSLALVDWLVVR